MAQSRINFLLVEDDDDHATLVSRHLSRIDGVNILHRARDGADALAFLRREGEFSEAPPPDVVLLDVNLPKFSGLEVLAIIKNHPDMTRIPVVMLTTSTNETDRKTAYKLHANSYLVKPLDYQKFVRLVDDMGHYWGDVNLPAPEE